MPEFTALFLHVVVSKVSAAVVDKCIPIVIKLAEDTFEKTVEVTDKGWVKDYYAGGMSAGFNKNTTQNA
jgi:hypothetical protein